MNYRRLKNNVPFSARLNEWILKRVKDLPYKAIKGLEEVDFKTFHNESFKNGYMSISADHCENNIFGSEEVNIAFRAWHDWCHIFLQEGFGYMEEARVAFYQCSELPEDWHEEKMLLMSEIVGQAAYHDKTGEFVPNQRKFTAECLIHGKI